MHVPSVWSIPSPFKGLRRHGPFAPCTVRTPRSNHFGSSSTVRLNLPKLVTLHLSRNEIPAFPPCLWMAPSKGTFHAHSICRSLENTSATPAADKSYRRSKSPPACGHLRTHPSIAKHCRPVENAERTGAGGMRRQSSGPSDLSLIAGSERRSHSKRCPMDRCARLFLAPRTATPIRAEVACPPTSRTHAHPQSKPMSPAYSPNLRNIAVLPVAQKIVIVLAG